jgi:tetratricopeptide (TPR) repeat protein
MTYFARLATISSVVCLFAATAFAGPAPVAQDVSSATQIKAEAYFYYCLARLDERNMRVEAAIENYERASELDPEAGYPHVALAELYDRTRRTELALQKAKRAIELDPDIAAAHRILGRTYFSMLRNGAAGDVEQLAIQAFQETVRLDPGDVESRSNLARLLIVSRRADEATEHLEEIVRLVPTAYYEMFLLAQVRQNQDRTEEAIGLLKQSLAVEPRQAEARELLLTLLQAQGRHGEIADVYQGAVELVPGDLDSRIRLADALANDGQLDAAAREFDVILVEDPQNAFALVGLGMVRRDQMQLAQAEELLGRALELEPNHVLGRYTLAGVYEQKRAFEEAAAEWTNLIELPDQSPEASMRRAEYWAHLGFAHEQLGRLDESVAAFSKARELSGGDERFQVFYIQGLLAAEQPDDALEAIDDVLENDPDSDRFKMLKARALDSRGDHDEAIELVLALSEQSPEDERLAQGVIEIYLQQKRYADTEAFISERLAASADDSIALRFQLAAALERQKKFSEAEAQFEKILEREPDSAAALNYLGYMLADQDRRLEESLDFVKRAVAQDPYNGAYLDSLGWVYFKMGDLDLAEESLLKAIDSMRLTGVVFDHLGDLYFQKGSRERAVEFWRKALDQDDDELEKDEVAQKIERANSNP